MGRWMAVVLSAWSLPTLSRAASYSFTTIDQPGATQNVLYGINDIGGIVGAYPGFQYENGTCSLHSRSSETNGY